MGTYTHSYDEETEEYEIKDIHGDVIACVKSFEEAEALVTHLNRV